MTGYEINRLFVKKFGIMIGPSMIYSKLYNVERKGLIKCVRNRAGRAYGLTEKGQEMVNNMNSVTEQIHSFMRTLLKLR
jgi:DNA-binding PadR family transcriptional regulator